MVKNTDKSKLLQSTCVLIIFIIIAMISCGIRLCLELKQLNETKENIICELEELNKKKNIIQTEIESLNKSQSELEKILKKYSEDIDECSENISELQKDKEKMQKEINVLESTIDGLTAEKEKLNQELSNLSTKIAAEENSNPYSFVYSDGEVDDKYIQLVCNELSLLPNKVLQFFEDNNMKIYVTTKNIASEIMNGQYKSLQGITFYDKNIIYIEDREIACKEATLHECGHLFNKYMGYVVRTNVLQDIYTAEKVSFQKISDEYSVSNIDEYFAETFLMYFKNNKQLELNCPRTNDYIKGLLDQL